MSFAVFLLYVFLSFFRPIELFAPEMAEYRPMLVLWTLGFVLAASRAIVRKEIAARGIDFKLLFAFMVMLGVSLALNGWAGGAFTAMNDFTTSSMLFVLVALNVTSLRRLKLACAAVVLSMLVSALFGIQAYHTGQFAQQLVLRQTAPQHEDEDPSRAPPSAASEIPALDQTGWYLWRVRGQGFLNDPNDFSQVLVMCLPLLFVLWRQRAWLRNTLLIVAPGAIMVYAIVLSQSRGALLGVASLLFFIVRDWLGTTRTAVLGGLAGVAFLGASAVGGRGFSSQEQSAGIEQVNQTIVQMDETTQQNAALVEEAAAAAESLEEQAHNLSSAVSIFKLDDTAAAPRLSAPGASQRSSAQTSPRGERLGGRKQPALPTSLDDEWEEF